VAIAFLNPDPAKQVLIVCCGRELGVLACFSCRSNVLIGAVGVPANPFLVDAG
jgi:hypothetical protein